jgi:hypothetical protein
MTTDRLLDDPDADTPERHRFRLYALLFRAAFGMVTRRGGQVCVDGVAANELQTLAVSVLDKRGWLVWINTDRDVGNVADCALSEAGDAQMQAWDVELFGPPTEPVASSRPLTCLDDLDVGEANLLLLRAVTGVDLTDLDGNGSCDNETELSS